MWNSERGSCGELMSERVGVKLLRTVGILALAGLSAISAAPAISIETGAEKPPRAAGASTDSPYGRRVVDIRVQPHSLMLDNPSMRDFELKTGDTLSPENLSAAMNQLKNHLSRHSEIIARELGGSALAFTYVDVQFDRSEERRVGK